MNKSSFLLITLAFVLSFILNGQEESSPLPIFANYDSRFGDSYGVAVIGEGLVGGISFGGILMNKIKVAIENGTGVTTEKQKAFNWNAYVGYVFTKETKGFYVGLGYTNIKYEFDNFYPASFGDSGGKIIHGTIDPLIGYMFAEKNKVFFDAKIGYGILVRSKEQITLNSTTKSLKAMTTWLNSYVPPSDQMDYKPMELLNKLFFSVSLGYSF